MSGIGAMCFLIKIAPHFHILNNKFFGLTFAIAIFEIFVTYCAFFLTISVHFANDITISQRFLMKKIV